MSLSRSCIARPRLDAAISVSMGHECASVVIEIGEGVENVKVGNRVGVNSLNQETREATGYNLDGGYTHKVLVPAKQYVHISVGVTFEGEAAATDASLTSYHALFAIVQAQVSIKVGIIGVDGLGQFVVQMALIQGCDVFATDVYENAKNL